MKYTILILAILSVVSCGKSDEAPKASSNENQSFNLTTAKGLCLYVVNEAEKETGDTKPPTVVTEAYKNITCLEVTSEHIAFWQCMKDKTDLYNSFYKADEYCAANY
jgi:hypothetical protein